MIKINYLSIIPETIMDGDGMRTSIYVSGCNHHCKGCHNPQTWDFKAGTPLTDKVVDDIIRHVNSNPLISGITFSGGDPLEIGNAKDLLPILKKMKQHNINIWCYTGYYFEDLVKTKSQQECLKYIDVLVDGPFVESLKDTDLLFKGSKNQRIIELSDYEPEMDRELS